jgi:hypothetical protein
MSWTDADVNGAHWYIPDDLPADHVCACRSCRPDDYPAFGWKGPSHAAVRLSESPHLVSAVRLDGRDVQASEAIQGLHGLAVVLSVPVHQCLACHASICERLVRGRVELLPMAEVG